MNLWDKERKTTKPKQSGELPFLNCVGLREAWKLLLPPRMNLLWVEQPCLKSLSFYVQHPIPVPLTVGTLYLYNEQLKIFVLWSHLGALPITYISMLANTQAFLMLSQTPEPASKTLQRAILISSTSSQLAGVPRALLLPHRDLSLGRMLRAKTAEHWVPPPSSSERSPTAGDGEGAEEGRSSLEWLRVEGAQMGRAELWALSSELRAPGWLWWLRGGSAQQWLSVPAAQGGCRTHCSVLLSLSLQFCLNQGVNSAWMVAKAARLSFHWYKLNWIKY